MKTRLKYIFFLLLAVVGQSFVYGGSNPVPGILTFFIFTAVILFRPKPAYAGFILYVLLSFSAIPFRDYSLSSKLLHLAVGGLLWWVLCDPKVFWEKLNRTFNSRGKPSKTTDADPVADRLGTRRSERDAKKPSTPGSSSSTVPGLNTRGQKVWKKGTVTFVGEPARDLAGTSSKFGDYATSSGVSGELKTVEVAEKLLPQLGFKGYFLNSLQSPWKIYGSRNMQGNTADTDHMLVGNKAVAPFNSKKWKGGSYNRISESEIVCTAKDGSIKRYDVTTDVKSNSFYKNNSTSGTSFTCTYIAINPGGNLSNSHIPFTKVGSIAMGTVEDCLRDAVKQVGTGEPSKGVAQHFINQLS